jgi:hypothetical protein
LSARDVSIKTLVHAGTKPLQNKNENPSREGDKPPVAIGGRQSLDKNPARAGDHRKMAALPVNNAAGFCVCDLVKVQNALPSFAL